MINKHYGCKQKSTLYGCLRRSVRNVVNSFDLRRYMSQIAVITAVLMAVITFLGACKHPTGYDGENTAHSKSYGRIAVSLTAGSQNARTVLPAPVFDRYSYTFTKSGETAGTELAPDSGGFFTLEVGSYTVAVCAFNLYEGLYVLSASGVSEQFSVTSGENEPVVVGLNAASSGEGEFAYIVTFPSDAVGDVYLYNSSLVEIGLSPTHVCDDNGLSETVELEAGTYLFVVKVSMNRKDAAGVQYAGISEAVHVYPGLMTIYDKEFVIDDFTTIAEPPEEPEPPQPPVEPPVNGNVKFEYYLVDHHDSLISTSGGTVSIASDEILIISAQGDGFTNQNWHLNGVNTGENGNTFNFSSTIAGRHTVGLFVEKDGKLYNTNIIITVEDSSLHTTRTVTVDMFDHLGDGWNGGGALRINVNGTTIANNVRVVITTGQNTPAGQRKTNTYAYPVTTGDVVQVFWIAGTSQNDNSFIMYYTDTPPIPAFTSENTNNWSGTNALIYKLRGTMTSITGGALLGTFTVSNPM